MSTASYLYEKGPEILKKMSCGKCTHYLRHNFVLLNTVASVLCVQFCALVFRMLLKWTFLKMDTFWSFTVHFCLFWPLIPKKHPAYTFHNAYTKYFYSMHNYLYTLNYNILIYAYA